MNRAIGAGIGNTSSIDWAERWQQSPNHQRTKEIVQKYLDEKQPSSSSNGGQHHRFQQRTRIGILDQIRYLCGRTFTDAWRTPEYNFARHMTLFMIALLLGLSFLQLGKNQYGITGKIQVLFFASSLANYVVSASMLPLFLNRPVFYKETASGTYHPWAYYFATGLVEIPFAISTALVFVLTVYFLVGLREEVIYYFILQVILFFLFALSMGQFFGIAGPSLAFSATAVPVLNSIMTTLSGIQLPAPLMPVYYYYTLYWVDPSMYFAGGVVSNEMGGVTGLYCTEGEYTPFYPLNYTIPQSMLKNLTTSLGQNLTSSISAILSLSSNFTSNTTVNVSICPSCTFPGHFPGCSNYGQIENTTTGFAELCYFCKWITGDQVLDSFGMTYDKWYVYLVVVIGSLILLKLLSFVLTRYVRWDKR